MSRYIDADALIAEMEHCSYKTWSKGVIPTWWAHAVKVKDNIKECIKRQPTADVVEVRHAHWVVCGAFDDFLKCSSCGYDRPWQTAIEHNYCPKCGAKMDGERKEV